MSRTDRASRVIAAPPGRVWAALVDPGALMAWLPPGGMTGRFERFDLRPGGSYRMVLTYADASTALGQPHANVAELLYRTRAAMRHSIIRIQSSRTRSLPTCFPARRVCALYECAPARLGGGGSVRRSAR